MVRCRHTVVFVLLMLSGWCSTLWGQSKESNPPIKVFNTVQVLDALSLEPAPDVQITLVRDTLSNTPQIKTRTGDGVADLSIRIKSQESFEILLLNKHGYLPLSHNFQPYQMVGDTIKLYLQPQPYENPQATVIGQKGKYSSVNNPAHDLAMRVAQEEKNNRNTQDYSYRQIDQVMISAANIEFIQNFLQSVVPFYHSYLISSKFDGSMILPLSYREVLREVGFNSTKRQFNEDIRYRNILGIDQNIDDGTLSVALHELFPSVDLFQRNIHLLDFDIPSPLSDIGRFHYKYYLTDTIVHQKKLAQVLEVIPHYPSVPSFRGKLIVSMDSIPRLLRSELAFPQFSNINFIERMEVFQNYAEVSPGQWHLVDEEMVTNVRMFHKIFRANVDHTRRYDKYNYHSPDSALVNSPIQYMDNSQKRDLKAYNDQLRMMELLPSDEGLKHFMGRLRGHPTHRFIMELVDAISVNYIRTRWDRNLIFGGSLVEIGPIDKMVGKGSFQGLRVQLGGRTTAFLSKRNFLDGYVAYSFNNSKPTYRISARHSFKPKQYYAEEYPRHDVTATYSHELFSPNNRFENEDGGNLLYNVGEPHLTHFSYRTQFDVRYHFDINSEISLQAFYEHATDIPTGDLEYVRVLLDNSIIRYDYLRDALFGMELRWSPGERIFEGSMQRENWYQRQRNQQPVFTFRYEHADPKLGGQYRRIRTELTVEQKLWLGAFGRLDYHINTGKIWHSVPFPLLYAPPLNRGFGVRRFSFKGLQRAEYVADEWLALFSEYHMRGALGNRIPLVNVLKLRGVLTANLLWGNTTKKNKQGSGEELFLLPNIATEMSYEKPYLEIGMGLENILEVIRIDVYRRLTPMGPHSEGPWFVKMDLNLNF